ncbi:hypothetical protein GOODEAATRI_024165 [Goodea atripinnis]|uniref:Uncharacterized protein n=1 Tax=Goodea atripinnis TaxID=208336 RepID=A0ABV0MKA5_9TELE
MLRTKAMREKEEQRERRKYNYTLIRLRLPDGNLLQVVAASLTGMVITQQRMVCDLFAATFYAWDRLPALFEFVRESLVDGWQPFEIIAPGGQKLQESEEVTLVECNLVLCWAARPAVLSGVVQQTQQRQWEHETIDQSETKYSFCLITG